MSKLGQVWDALPQRLRDAVGRFVKVAAAAGTLAAGTYIVQSITGGNAIDPSALGAAVALAVVSAVEKYFDLAPRASQSVKAKVRKV